MAQKQHKHEFEIGLKGVLPPPWYPGPAGELDVSASCVCGARATERFRAKSPWESDYAYRSEVMAVYRELKARAEYMADRQPLAKKAAWRRYKSRRCGVVALA